MADGKAQGWKRQNVLQYIDVHAGDPMTVIEGSEIRAANQRARKDKTGSGKPSIARSSSVLGLGQVVHKYGWSDISSKMKPLNTVENLEWMLQQYGITVRYNVISKDVEIQIPNQTFTQDQEDVATLAMIQSLCARNGLAQSNVSEYLKIIADRNIYSPAKEWICSRGWDGVDRLEPLVKSLNPTHIDLARVLLKRWMVGAVKCATEMDGVSMQGVLVLQGAQGIGKTSWFWALLDFLEALGKEGAILNPTEIA